MTSLPTAQKMAAVGAAFGCIATFVYTQMVYYVPDGRVGLLFNQKRNVIENYIMHPGSHIRFSRHEFPVFLKVDDVYNVTVPNVAVSDKKKVGDVSVSAKLSYRISVKDAPTLYSAYGPQEVYQAEVFDDITGACVKSVVSPYKLANLQKGIETDETFLRDALTKCISSESSRRFVQLEWAQIMSAKKSETSQ